LIHDAAVGVAVVAAVVALLDQGPGFLLLLLFGVDELFDIPVPVAQGVHFGRAPGLAAGLHDVGDLIVDLEKAEGTTRTPATAEVLLAAADGAYVGAGAGAVFEEHGLGVGEAHDVFHVVLDGLNEA